MGKKGRRKAAASGSTAGAGGAGGSRTIVGKRAERERRLEAALGRCLLQLARQSHECMEFARKCGGDLLERGCVMWLFEDLSAAEDKPADTPLVFRNAREAATFEYAPVSTMIEQYTPTRMIVVLVSIRTGDVRDSLMKSAVIGCDAASVANVARVPWLSLRFCTRLPSRLGLPSGEGVVGAPVAKPKLRYCSSLLCNKLEAEEGQFKLCQRCKFRRYCARECQVLHWKKLGHKKLCAIDKQQMEALSKPLAVPVTDPSRPKTKKKKKKKKKGEKKKDDDGGEDGDGDEEDDEPQMMLLSQFLPYEMVVLAREVGDAEDARVAAAAAAAATAAATAAAAPADELAGGAGGAAKASSD